MTLSICLFVCRLGNGADAATGVPDVSSAMKNSPMKAAEGVGRADVEERLPRVSQMFLTLWKKNPPYDTYVSDGFLLMVYINVHQVIGLK